MRIDKNSWHYRVVRWIGDVKVPMLPHFIREESGYGPPEPMPTSLCSYMIHLVFLTPLTLASIPLFFVGIWLIALLSYSIKWVVVNPIVWTVHLIGWLWLRRRRREEPGEELPVSTPQLFLQWASARHRKVCPLIEYVESDSLTQESHP